MSSVNESFEVDALRVREITLPASIRPHGLMVLVTDFVPYWKGPEPAGWEYLFAQSFHQGADMDSDGMTLWFFREAGATVDLPLEVLVSAADYILPRLGRRSHFPTSGYTCRIFIVPNIMAG